MNLYGKQHEWSEESGAVTPYDNILPAVLVLIGIAAVVSVTRALEPAGGGFRDELTRCVTIANDHTRLACYDKLAAPRPPARGAFAPAQIEPGEGPL